MGQEATHIDAAIADLEAWRDKIETAIQTLRHFRVQGAALPSTPPPSGSRAPGDLEIPHDAFFQMTVVEAAEKYLRLTKKTKPIPELASALLKGGLKSSSKRFSEMVRIMLIRDQRFVKVNSEWGLTEWYPGMRKKARSTPDQSPGDQNRTSQKDEESTSARKKRPLPPKKRSGPSIKERTLKVLTSHPSDMFTSTELAKRLGEAKPTVTTMLCALVGDGVVVRPEKGKYQSKH